MAKKKKFKNSKIAEISWKALGIIFVLLFIFVFVRLGFTIKNDWKYVFGGTAQAQAMEYEIEEEPLTLALYSEGTETPEETDAPEQSEEEKETIGDKIDKKGEEIAGIINAETGLALSGGSIIIIAIAYLLFLR